MEELGISKFIRHHRSCIDVHTVGVGTTYYLVCPSFLWLRRRANNMAISPLLPIRFPWFQVQDRSEQVFFLVFAYAGCLTGQLRGRNSRPKLVRCRRELDRPVTPCFVRESWVITQFARIPRLKGIQNILKLITNVGSCYMTTYVFLWT